MKHQRDSYIGSLAHRVLMFAMSLVFLAILIRVIIVAVPGYDFHTWFDESDILTELDSLIIRGVSVIGAIAMAISSIIFAISIADDEFSERFYRFMRQFMTFADEQKDDDTYF